MTHGRPNPMLEIKRLILALDFSTPRTTTDILWSVCRGGTQQRLAALKELVRDGKLVKEAGRCGRYTCP